MDEDEEYEEYEEQPVYFLDCTCDHEEEDHGWGSCDVEGCDCQGGWEE